MDGNKKTLNLYSFQQEIIDKTRNVKNVAYYWDMGCGKTYIGAEKARLNNTRTILCICQKSKIKDWKEHFETYYDYETYDLTNKKQLTLFFEDEKRKVGVINYEMIYRIPMFKSLYDFTLLLDESSLLQNMSAKRTDYIVNELEPSNVILLSGTPCSGHYEKLYPQMKLLGIEKSESRWWNDYVISKRVKADKYKGTPGTWGTYVMILGYKNTDRMKRELASLNCYFKKAEEVLKDLPEKTYIEKEIYCEEYDKMLRTKQATYKDITKELDELNTLQKLAVCRLFSSICISNEKREWIKDFIEATDDRILIFYNYKEEYEILKKMAEELKRPLSTINGQLKDLDNYETKDNSITLLQYQSGSFGLNLQKANKTIYASLPLSSEFYEQSGSRTARLGQTRPCFYYVLITGIEKRIKQLLNKKQDYTNDLFRKDFEKTLF